MNFDSTIVAGLIGLIGAIIGAIIGAAITGYFVLAQTSKLLTEENRRSELEQERETKSVATALLWEIDYFYKIYIRNTCRTLATTKTSELRFYVKPLDFVAFPIFDATADKVGLFEPDVVRSIVAFYGSARSYLETLIDYGNSMSKLQGGDVSERSRAVMLLDKIKDISGSLVEPSKGVCQLLAKRTKAEYTFDAP